MQKQPEGRETEPTNLGRLRRPANLLVYDNFHPLCSSCGDAETLLEGLWGRTLRWKYATEDVPQKVFCYRKGRE